MQIVKPRTKKSLKIKSRVTYSLTYLVTRSLRIPGVTSSLDIGNEISVRTLT